MQTIDIRCTGTAYCPHLATATLPSGDRFCPGCADMVQRIRDVLATPTPTATVLAFPSGQPIKE